jgi:hypothetical protein
MIACFVITGWVGIFAFFLSSRCCAGVFSSLLYNSRSKRQYSRRLPARCKSGLHKYPLPLLSLRQVSSALSIQLVMWLSRLLYVLVWLGVHSLAGIALSVAQRCSIWLCLNWVVSSLIYFVTLSLSWSCSHLPGAFNTEEKSFDKSPMASMSRKRAG